MICFFDKYKLYLVGLFSVIRHIAELFRVDLTTSQLAICVEILHRGVSHQALQEAISLFSKPVNIFHLLKLWLKF